MTKPRTGRSPRPFSLRDALTERDLFRGSALCVVGNLNRDLRVGGCPSGRHLFTDGETSVESIVETVGGGGANSACAASALGARVAFLGKIGADALGRRLTQALRKQGIDARLAVDPIHP